jgi:hypothetical protein
MIPNLENKQYWNFVNFAATAGNNTIVEIEQQPPEGEAGGLRKADGTSSTSQSRLCFFTIVFTCSVLLSTPTACKNGSTTVPPYASRS